MCVRLDRADVLDRADELDRSDVLDRADGLDRADELDRADGMDYCSMKAKYLFWVSRFDRDPVCLEVSVGSLGLDNVV